MNYFIIGGDKKEYGPAPAEQIRAWLREGRANGETLLRLEGETLWKPLRSFTEFAPDLPRPAGPPPLPEGETGAVSINVGHCFNRAWHLASEHFGVVAGASFLTWMALTALFLMPCGPLLLLPLEGPLYGGLYLVFLKLIRTGEASPMDIFVLGRENAVPLILASTVMTLLSTVGLCALVLPWIYLKIAWLLAIPLIAERGLNFWQGMEFSRVIVTRQWLRFFFLAVMAFLPLIVFRIYMQIRIGTEMSPRMQQILAESGNSHEQVAHKIYEMLIEIAKANPWLPVMNQLLLLLTLPIGIGCVAYAYEDLFGRKR